jgi:hypothetical protein
MTTARRNIKKKRKKSVTLGKTRKSRQKKRCDRMFRHRDTGRCIEVDGRLARVLYPDKRKRMKAFKERPCRGELHWNNSRWRCIDPYARRQRRKARVTVTGKKKSKGFYARKLSKFYTRKKRSRSRSKTSEEDELLALLSKL